MDLHFRTSAAWIVIVVATCIGTSSALAVGRTASFNIPAGTAPQTLYQFYLQSQVRVLYIADTVKDVKTQEVTGNLDATDALSRLLQGSGLTYKLDGDAAVIFLAPNSIDTPHASGAGPYILPIYDASNVTKLHEILITGSLIHGVLDISSPLAVVDRQEIKKSSFATIQDVMRALPMASNITRGEVLAGTGNFGRGASINLRGLGDGATLVLVNGRRQPVTGTQGDFVDVSNLPWAMVDRIEVLPDGGSALYGSDAIAGVVNIILRQNLEGAETQARYGTAHDGAAETMIAQLAGHGWASGHWLAAYQYSERTSLAAADRRFTANADKRPMGGSDFRRISSNPGNIVDLQTLQPAFAIPRGQDGRSLTTSDLLPGVVNYQNQFANVELLPNVHTHSVYFTGSQHLSEHVELFADGRYGEREVRQRPWIPDQGFILVPATNPFFVDAYGAAPFVIMGYDFAKDFGPYGSLSRTRNYSGSLGLKIAFARSWQASLAASFGRESLDATDHGLIDPVGLNVALADPNPDTAFNPFGDGSNTNPATIAASQTSYRYTATSEIPALQLQADGPVFDLPTGMVKAAIGVEGRQENWGANILGKTADAPGNVHARLGRTIAAAFTELSVPLIGEATDPHAVPKLELSLAGRYEHYSDFGATFNPKVGLRWTPLTAIKLRTSWSTSFKAPNLMDLYDANNTSGIVSLQDPRSSTGRSTVLYAVGGNPDLNEERATTWTVGLDVAPPVLPGFQLSLTGFSINYQDQVIAPGPPDRRDILLQEDQWSAVIFRNPSQSQIDAVCGSTTFVLDPAQCRTSSPAVLVDVRMHNLASTKVSGLDLTLKQVLNTNVGYFNVDVNGSFVFHFKRAFTNTAPVTDIVDTVGNTLKLRLRGTVGWEQHGEHQPGFAANLTANYAGGYKDLDSAVQSNVNAWPTFDLGLRYRTGQRGDWADDTELALNIVNVLNEDPPFVDREWGYDIVNARPEGRVISATLSKRW